MNHWQKYSLVIQNGLALLFSTTKIHSGVYIYFIFLYFLNYWIHTFLFHMDKTGCLLTAWLR